MKKRFWIILLALILALGALCVGASAENESFAASVTSNGVTQYYGTVQEAFEAAKNGDTVGILNFGTATFAELTVDKNLTVELVGSVSGLYNPRFRFRGSVTFISAGVNGSPAAFSPFVIVENGGTLTVPEYYDSEKTAANAISFTNVLVETGSSAALGSGTYSYLTADGSTVTLSGSSVRVSSSLSVQNGGTLIADGGGQIDWLNVSGGKATVSGSGLERLTVQNGGTVTLTNCTVKSSSPVANGSTVSGGSLTVNGSSSEIKDLTVKDGGVTVTGGMLSGLLTVDGGTVEVSNAIVKRAEINAGSFTLGKDAVFDEFELHICGGEAIIDGGTVGLKTESYTPVFCNVTAEGGKLTLRSGEIVCATEIMTGAQAELKGGNFGDVNVVGGKLTVDGAVSKRMLDPSVESKIYLYPGGETEVLSGSCDLIYVYKDGKLTVSGGSCDRLSTAFRSWDSITLRGGSFGTIELPEYETKEDKVDYPVTFADFASMLAPGKAYQKKDGTAYLGMDKDMETDQFYGNINRRMLHNVTVADAPFTGLTITGDSRVTYGGSVSLMAEMDTEPAGVTYQWYRNGEPISGETSPSYATDPALDAGDYTYTVEAASNGYVTGASTTVTVEPKVIYPVLDRSKLSKTYDGTADATVVITGFSFDIRGETKDISADAIKYEITDPQYEDYYDKITANVNEAKKVRYTLALKETNYALGKDYDTGDFYRTETNHVEVGDNAITKARIGSDYAISGKRLTILNKHLLKTYELVLADYLPKLDGEKTYGSVDYSILSIDLTTYYNPWMGMYEATLENGILSLPILYKNTEETENVGVIRLNVKPTNYEPFDLIINVDASNKLLPTGTAVPDRTALTYGEKLSDITLSGEMKDGDTVVAGTFQWDLPDEVPEIGEYDANWTFEPAEDERYLPVKGTVRITVSPETYAVTVAETEHGSVGSSRRYASQGQIVTLTVTPEDGYVLETLTVATRSGKEIALTDLGGGKFSFRMPGSRVTVAAGFAEDNSVLNFFVDVPNDSYYYEAVKWAAENGITAGVDALHFAPGGDCTRAQIAAFLWRAAGSPEPARAADFADVAPDAYYAKAVAWAAENGIVLGTGAGFEPDRVCTRAEAVAMIYREIQRRGGGFTGAWMFRLPFTDTLDWAYEATAWCYMHGITEGVSETAFGSDDPCTRAHIVTFLRRAFGE